MELKDTVDLMLSDDWKDRLNALPPNPSDWEEEYYDQKFSKYVEID